MPSSIFLLAAGSLRPAFTPLTSQFTRMSGIDVKVEYGPAGLLRERKRENRVHSLPRPTGNIRKTC